jgi:hypothetical protein
MPIAVREWKSPPSLKAVNMLVQLAMCACIQVRVRRSYADEWSTVRTSKRSSSCP